VGKEGLVTIAWVDGSTLSAVTTEGLEALARMHTWTNILAGGVISTVMRSIDSAIVDSIAILAITRIANIARTRVLGKARFCACCIATAVAMLQVAVLEFLAHLPITRVMGVAKAVPFAGASVLACGVGVATCSLGLQAHIDGEALLAIASETLFALASALTRASD
jgi:hypothetical protein